MEYVIYSEIFRGRWMGVYLAIIVCLYVGMLFVIHVGGWTCKELNFNALNFFLLDV